MSLKDVGLANKVCLILMAFFLCQGTSNLSARFVSGDTEAAFALSCNQRFHPGGIETESLFLGWKLPAAAVHQTSYRILVSTSSSLLDSDQGDLWDSDKVMSDKSQLVRYQGQPLESFQKVWWKVKVWDENGDELSWSETATWQMGMLNPLDHKAEWITAEPPLVHTDATWKWIEMSLLDHPEGPPEYLTYRTDMLSQNRGNLIFATSFHLDEVPESALSFATAQGFYTVYINGERISDAEFEPATGYTNAPVYYDQQEVSDLLQTGSNEIRVVIRRGRHELGKPNFWQHITEGAQQPDFWMQLIDPENPEQPLAKTDADWKYLPGSIIKGNFYVGEVYDGRRGYIREEVSISDPEWQPVSITSVDREIKERTFPPERVIREVTPINVFSPAKDVWVFDLGEIITGTIQWVESPSMEQGDPVIFRHTQHLMSAAWDIGNVHLTYPDSCTVTSSNNMIFRAHYLGINHKPKHFLSLYPEAKNAMKYAGNKNAAISTDLYLCSGQAGREWTSTERIQAFRYVEVIGLKDEPSVEDLKAFFIHTDMERVGDFSCSNEYFNEYYRRAIKVDLMNDHGLMADCWDREKWSWNGENVHKSSHMPYTYNLSPLLRKLNIENARLAADNGGKPSMNTHDYRTTVSPLWEQSMIQLPWFSWLFTGDYTYIEDVYEEMLGFLKYHYPGSFDNAIRTGSLGDHMSKGDKKMSDEDKEYVKKVLVTACFFEQADKLKQMAEAIGVVKDTSWLSGLMEATRRDLIEDFFDFDNKTFGHDPENLKFGTDVEDFMVGHTNLIGGQMKADVLGSAVQRVIERDTVLYNGTQTMWRALDVLSDNGYVDIAYAAMNQPGVSGIPRNLELCPDGICERFHVNAPGDAGSNTHATMGQICRWFFYGLGGLKADPENPGFKHFYLSPQVPSQMDSVNIYHDSPYGTIRSEWTQQGDHISWKATVPPNTTATLVFPNAIAAYIQEDGQGIGSLSESIIQGEDNTVTMSVGPGDYAFDWKKASAIPEGIVQSTAAAFTVVPNPVSQQLSIHGLEESAEVTIMSLDGKQVYQDRIDPDELLDTAGYLPGLYMLIIKGASRSGVCKFCKI